MWLLNTSTLKLTEFWGANIPAYAIISHTWNADEISYQEMQDLTDSTRQKQGFHKIERFCQWAKVYSLDYAWIDTCCIDKRSSAELTEAVNSMYRWYYGATVCLIYLDDVAGCESNQARSLAQQVGSFRKSRYFTRGWTLQEILACSHREFFAADWSLINSRRWPCDIISACAEVTGIDEKVLRDRSKLNEFCVAERMSWAANRQTSRPEDAAYSLMGIFRVNMPILYGEGLEGAFRRLQDEIMKVSFDQTLFAWRGNYPYSGLLARTPSDFQRTPPLGHWWPSQLSPFSMTNVGLSIRALVSKKPHKQASDIVTMALRCVVGVDGAWQCLLIRLQHIEDVECYVAGVRQKTYQRVNCSKWDILPNDELSDYEYVDILVLENAHFELMSQVAVADRRRKRSGKHSGVRSRKRSRQSA